MIEVMEQVEGETDVRRLEADVAEVAGVLNAAHGRLVQLAAELIVSEAWRGHGIRSVEHWLCLRAGLSHHHARQVVAVARRSTDLPVTVASLSTGQLSLEQVIEVARFVPAHNDAEAASLAAATTVSQLHNTLSRYRFSDPVDPATTPDEGDPSTHGDDPATRRGKLVLVHEPDRFGLHVDAPLDDGALIEQALLEAKDALFHAGQPDVTWMDALTEVCHRSLSSVGSASRRDRYRVYVHLDIPRDSTRLGKAPPIVPDAPGSAGWLNQGPALPPVLVDKLCCDGTVQPLWHTDSVPVSVGRALRIVPDRTRRLVLDRDRGCIVPGCGSRYHLEIHHLLAWSRGGRTDTANLACLCPFHHDALHRGELIITGNADDPATLRFTDGDGRPIPTAAAPTPTSLTWTDEDIKRPAGAGRYRPPTGERIDNRCVHFTPRGWHTTNAADPNAPPA